MNPYHGFVSQFAALFEQGKTFPLGGFKPAPRPTLSPEAPKALFFAPHPDDECIVGGLALRILRELRMAVSNVAVTQGSNKERQPERLRELQAACDYIGFGLISTAPNGLEKINPRARTEDPAHWSACVTIIQSILQNCQPKVILFPHEHDWNSTHIGTHFLIMDALSRMPETFECFLVETEFWGQMTEPNLMVEISGEDLADLITATTFHVGEVKRNAYHLLLPPWMMDNVRRGAELVGGQGRPAPDFKFAALYRLLRWRGGRAEKFFEGGKQISRRANLGELFS
jgi:LmbE family N-acetylglucosaminyl deacetylase